MHYCSGGFLVNYVGKVLSGSLCSINCMTRASLSFKELYLKQNSPFVWICMVAFPIRLFGFAPAKYVQ